MEYGLAGCVGVVTGASSGIGAAIARGLAAEGMKLVLVARRQSDLDATARDCAARGGEAAPFVADLQEPAAAAASVAFAIARFGTLDLLVNCAGATRRGDFLTLSDADWEAGFALKLHGAVRLCRAAWPHLCASRGAIVNIGGVGGRVADPAFTIGGAVNAAMMNLTKALAARGVGDGVRVNQVNPGYVRTERLEAGLRRMAESDGVTLDEAARTLAERTGIKRFAAPEEIAAAVAFLASPLAASYVQGSLMDVDGGWVRAV